MTTRTGTPCRILPAFGFAGPRASYAARIALVER
jgi:hypothetical protein